MGNVLRPAPSAVPTSRARREDLPFTGTGDPGTGAAHCAASPVSAALRGGRAAPARRPAPPPPRAVCCTLLWLVFELVGRHADGDRFMPGGVAA